MKIYMLRHGESIANTEKLYNPIDDELSELGKAQALAAAEYVQKLVRREHLKVLCSSLFRARQTASLLGVSVKLVDALADWNVGEYAGKKYGSIGRHCQEKSISKEHLKPAGGETMTEFKARVRKYVKKLSGKNYLIIAHTDVILEIVRELTGKPWAKCPAVQNVSIWEVEDNKLVKWNQRPWEKD